MRDQTFSGLNDAELQWIEDCVEQARVQAAALLQLRVPPSLDSETLDKVFALWLAQWQSGEIAGDPNEIVNSIGSAFGQLLVDSLGMQWVVVTDVSGTDMGVSSGPPTHRVLVFPTHAVANRLAARESGFMQRLADIIRMQVGGLTQ